MKKVLFILLALVIFQIGAIAQQKTCCSMHATNEFAMLGSNAQFQTAHLPPKPINFQAKKGAMITFDTPDGGKGNAFMVPALVKTDNYLFVFHEWWGLNDHIRREAEQFAEELGNVNVMAIDLYDGLIATNAEDAGRIMQTIKHERGEAIIKGALQHIRSNAVIQTIGWCFGGGWSLQAAMLIGDKAKGCVIYYGMPEKDEAKLKNLNVPVLGIFATKDGWINREVVDAFEDQMKSLNKKVSIHWFDAVHAFANPSNPEHDEKSAATARKLSLDFIRGNF
jgi:carboxymethylenebutenolidase